MFVSRNVDACLDRWFWMARPPLLSHHPMSLPTRLLHPSGTNYPNHLSSLYFIRRRRRRIVSWFIHSFIHRSFLFRASYEYQERFADPSLLIDYNRFHHSFLFLTDDGRTKGVRAPRKQRSSRRRTIFLFFLLVTIIILCVVLCWHNDTHIYILD